MEICVGSLIRRPYRILPPEFNALPLLQWWLLVDLTPYIEDAAKKDFLPSVMESRIVGQWVESPSCSLGGEALA
jgi:hypothetical protein